MSLSYRQTGSHSPFDSPLINIRRRLCSPLCVCVAKPVRPTSHAARLSVPRAITAGTALQGQLFMTHEVTESVLEEEEVHVETAWLARFSPFSRLGPDAVAELAGAMRPRHVAAGEQVMEAGGDVAELVMLREGAATATQHKAGRLGAITNAGPGTLFGWRQLLTAASETCCAEGTCTAFATTDVKMTKAGTVWAIPAAEFMHIASRHPEMAWTLTAELAQELAAAEAAIEEDEQRHAELQPYLIGNPEFDIIGTSKYAVRLRKDIANAAAQSNRGPLLIFGEPGLMKTDIAALVHFKSADRHQFLAGIDCHRLDAEGTLLFGNHETKGLLYWLGNGTLVLKDLDEAPEALVPRLQLLVACGEYTSVPSQDGSIDVGQVQKSGARIMLMAETRTPPVVALEPLCTKIQVPPLRLRLKDIAALADHFLLEAASHGAPRQTLSRKAVIRLESYKYPNNLRQLQSIVARAAAQETAAGQITEDALWFVSQEQDRFRVNLLDTFPTLRKLLRSPMWTRGFNYSFTAPAYALYLAVLFMLPQDRAHNFGLNLFWDWWWPGIFLVYPFLGRVWCSVCPFMIYGELVQQLRVSQGAVLKKWPRQELDQWGPWFLFTLFFGILVWEEVWVLNDTAYLSAWLLIIITAGAVACSAFFEKRMWCRYLCPIGGMNGMFAKLSMTEVRGREGVCAAMCNSYHCFKGGAAEGLEGLETFGCPVSSHPAQLPDNKNCVLCMDCVKACPNRSVEFRLRPPGVDLWTTHKPSAAELALMFMLLGAVFVHHTPQILAQWGFDDDIVADKLPHMVTTALLLAAPGALCWTADAVGRVLQGRGRGPEPFLRLAYGYLPLVWAATLAHYLDFGLTEAGRILPVTAATFGYEAYGMGLPTFVAGPDIVAFLQGGTLAAGAGLSLLLTRKLGATRWRNLLPQGAAILALTAELWGLIV